jgi:PEP-CTERM/exosortase A-associated glycosyltransferase
MRILHVLDHSLPLHSGYAFRTLSILREQRALGWETLQLTTPRHGPSGNEVETIDGWRFHRTPPPHHLFSAAGALIYMGEMVATARRIEELVGSFYPDVLHAHSPVLNALPALRVGRKLGIPVVYEVRSLWEDAAVNRGTAGKGSLRYRGGRALETFALRNVDHVTTICEGLRAEITARGVPPDRITVIPNAVDTAKFRFGTAPDSALRATLKLGGKTVVGFAGSFSGYEGLDLLLEAAAMLLPQRPDLRVLLVGGGPHEQALRLLAAKLGLADQVIFTGRVPHSQVQQYYDLIDLLAYPRRRTRLTDIVTPLKPLEAMAQGRMLVASDVGGHRELIRDGETGFLFPADDARALALAIDSILRRPELWGCVREQARRFVETERTWTRSVARYADVYGRLSERRHGSSGQLKRTGP